MKPGALLLIACLFAPGCVPDRSEVVEDVWKTRAGRGDEARRNAYVLEHPELPEETAAAILEGGVLPGMTRDEVRASLGIPDRESSLAIDGTPRRVWEYGTVGVVFVDGALAEFRDLSGR